MAPAIVSACAQTVLCCGLFYVGRLLYTEKVPIRKVYFWAPTIASRYFRWVGVFFMVVSGLSIALITVTLVTRLI